MTYATPKHSRNIPEHTPETLQKHSRNTADTPWKHITETSQEQIRNIPENIPGTDKKTHQKHKHLRNNPQHPRDPAAGLRATRYIGLLDKTRLLDKPRD